MNTLQKTKFDETSDGIPLFGHIAALNAIQPGERKEKDPTSGAVERKPRSLGKPHKITKIERNEKPYADS